MTRLSAGYKAFREPDIISDPLDSDADFSAWDSRRLRYNLYWAMFENTSYRDVHKWAKQYRIDHGLYKYIRNIYNPSYRLGEFWKSHLWGGLLDDAAGDGKEEYSALPIATENEALRPAIAQLWQWSNWQIAKDLATLYGSVLGDVALYIVEDEQREKVYIDVVHPGIIKEVEADRFGNVKAYIIEEERQDPTADREKAVTYTERAYREPGTDNVIYETFLNGIPFGWDDNPPQWELPYGFIPMTIVQHNNVGLPWGWSELHALRSKIHEVDDLVSKLDDQIRKTVDVPWLFAGMTKADATPTTTETTLTGTAAQRRPQPGREEIPALYARDPNAKPHPLIAPLDIEATGTHIKDILLVLEEDAPELTVSRTAKEASGEKSGKAIREARRLAETKVNQRRPNYDNALVRAHQMAIAIAGFRGYGDEFGGFNLDSFAAGTLDHTIGRRPVFQVDQLDDLEIKAAQAATIKTMTDAGVSIEQAALFVGVEADIARMLMQVETGVER